MERKENCSSENACIMPGYCSCGFVFWDKWAMSWQNV